MENEILKQYFRSEIQKEKLVFFFGISLTYSYL